MKTICIKQNTLVRRMPPCDNIGAIYTLMARRRHNTTRSSNTRTDREKGVVPFLKDVVAAFISTLVLMIFGVNFLLFSSLSKQGLDTHFNIGGDTCNIPCLSHPSIEVTKSAMVDREEGLRRKLCSRAYKVSKMEDFAGGGDSTHCANCTWYEAYFYIIYDIIVSLLQTVKGLIRSLICKFLEIIKIIVIPMMQVANAGVKMMAKLMGAAASEATNIGKAVGGVVAPEIKLPEVEDALISSMQKGSKSNIEGFGQTGGAFSDAFDTSISKGERSQHLRNSVATGASNFAAGARNAGSAVATVAGNVAGTMRDSRVGQAVGSAAGAAGDKIKAGASAIKEGLSREGIKKGAKATKEGISKGAKATKEGLSKGASKAGKAVKGAAAKGIGLAGAATGAATAAAEATEKGLEDWLKKLGGCCKTDAFCEEQDPGSGKKCGRGSKCRLPDPDPRESRKCPVAIDTNIRVLRDGLGKDVGEAIYGNNQGEAKENEGITQQGGNRRSSIRKQFGGANGDQDGDQDGGTGQKFSNEDLHYNYKDIFAKDTYCSTVGKSACAIYEERKLGFTPKEDQGLKEAEIQAQRYKSILNPPWPYSGWFQHNRKEAIEMARGGVEAQPRDNLPAVKTAKEYLKWARDRIEDAARTHQVTLTEHQVKAYADDELEIELGKRTEGILNGNPGEFKFKKAEELDTSLKAQRKFKGIFRYIGGNPAPPLVTGSTPFDDEETFGGKWGNWLAASTSSTAIGYRSVMRKFSTMLSGQSGTREPTAIWIRLLMGVLFFSLLGGSIATAPLALWSAVFSIMSIYSLWQHAFTAPLGLGWPISNCIGLWGVFASFIISPIQAMLQTASCVFYMTLYFIFKTPKMAKTEIFTRAWGPALALFSALVVASAWSRLDEYDYIPLSITIATCIAVFTALRKWWAATAASHEM